MSAELLHELPSVRRQRRRLTRWSLLGIVVGSALMLVGYVYNVIAIEERIRQIARLQRACDSLEALVAYRRQQLAQLEAPERIIPAAHRLGLELPARPPQVLSSPEAGSP
ncbi:Cell division protein FtsL [bacterium HR21]|jgi:cell division protein FtsL|nr:Cell division protein FtsL [bacterium HR21]